uniref:Putative secreted protein n=1 Tax=Anopheles darlingi TaxID=43151 RepID=A0A2M4DIP2_ANODA
MCMLVALNFPIFFTLHTDVRGVLAQRDMFGDGEWRRLIENMGQWKNKTHVGTRNIQLSARTLCSCPERGSVRDIPRCTSI